MTAERYDYVIVGGGSAGCIIAAELSADPAVTVLVLEAGDSADEHPETFRSDGYKLAFINDRLIWERFSRPQPECGRQRLFMGSGTGLGGSGSVNGMVYIRGAREDFDQWPDGWHWDDVVGDFEAVERVIRPTQQPKGAFTEACIAASNEAGFRTTSDMHDGDLTGVLGYEWMNCRDGERRSSYVTFLRPALSRDNLAVETRARVRRVVFDEKARARGVEVERGGERVVVEAAHEVILCAGALESPKLLMLSGVGPREHLREHGIDVVADRPGVGENLHDHPNVTLFFLGDRDVDCFQPQLYGFDRVNPALPMPESQSDTCFVFYPARSSVREAAMRLVPTKLPEPMYRVRFVRWLVRALLGVILGWGPIQRFIRRVWGVVVILGKPVSRGRLRLASADPRAPADLDPAYFRDDADMETMIRGAERARSLAHAPALAEFGNRELMPGRKTASDAALRRFVEKNAMTTYHYAGACRMGGDPASVVDPQLRVRGVTCLRVADASVVPFTPVSAMNAPSMLVGYRAARLVRDARLAAAGTARAESAGATSG